ncbi:MAG: TIGR02270 family protein [Gammaproteobacteria bacterium]|nr:TIGR02270 family protein [Gammaproteobacteria bacterium]
MTDVIDKTETKPVSNASAYQEIFERYVDDASFLWILRSIAVEQPHYNAEDIAELEQRIEAHLSGLMTSVEQGWQACEAALLLEEPGEVFTATIFAVRSHDAAKIQKVVEAGLANAEATSGLVSAFGWLPTGLASPWVKRFISSKDIRHKYLGIAAASVRREDPGALLAKLLEREDCQQNIPLYTRMLRLVGELRRQDLMPSLQSAQTSDNPDVQFWSIWSAIMLGNKSVVGVLQSYVFNGGAHQANAAQLAFRTLPVETARAWISTLAKNNEQARIVIQATGVLGDPHAVNWLITKMADPKLARLAGESFTQITGVDFAQHALTAEEPSNQEQIPNDDTADDDIGLDEDENLPWPDVAKITGLWRNHGQHFMVGQRYFLGKPITADWLKQKLATGTQRQRHAAALELALSGETPLINTRARILS